MKFFRNQKGLTLIEILIALAISAFVMAGIYSTFNSQYKSYMIQERIVAMQQNLRAGFYQLERNIRLAGFDPTGNAGAGIEYDPNFQPSSKKETLTANNSITVSFDLNKDGDINDDNERISFYLYKSATTKTINLGMKRQNTTQYVRPIAENIDAINFIYLGADGTPVSNIKDTKSVQIAIVARTEKNETGFINNKSYFNMQGTPFYTASGDKKRRRLFTSQIQCKNLGLQE